jgi:hypothetical protein
MKKRGMAIPPLVLDKCAATLSAKKRVVVFERAGTTRGGLFGAGRVFPLSAG